MLLIASVCILGHRLTEFLVRGRYSSGTTTALARV
jgi:hypothetical protein